MRPAIDLHSASLGAWILATGFAVLATPTLIALANQSWSHDFGAYGPIVLATGVWLIGRKLPAIRAQGRPGDWRLTALLLAPSALLYGAGRAFGFLSLEAAGVYGVVLAILQSKYSLKALAPHWFPILYLAFVVPPPNALLADLTAPLKQFVSSVSTGLLHFVGLPVARQGVTIFIAQYELLVEDACSGMNSIVGLGAIGLLYVYLTRAASWIYSAIMLTFVIPIAILANILRIIVLILLTYYCGNAAAQGYLHFAAGMLLFLSALCGVFALDRLLAYVRGRFRCAA
jgi:exosortase